MRKALMFLGVLPLLAILGCPGRQGPSSPAAPTATATSTTTSTVTLVPTGTATATNSATSTLTATLTATPSPTRTATSTPTSTVTSTATSTATGPICTVSPTTTPVGETETNDNCAVRDELGSIPVGGEVVVAGDFYSSSDVDVFSFTPSAPGQCRTYRISLDCFVPATQNFDIDILLLSAGCGVYQAANGSRVADVPSGLGPFAVRVISGGGTGNYRLYIREVGPGPDADSDGVCDEQDGCPSDPNCQ